MRTGESLPGGGCLLPSSGFGLLLAPGFPSSSAAFSEAPPPSSRDSRRESCGRARVPHAAVAFPQHLSGRGGSSETHGNAQNPKLVRTSCEPPTPMSSHDPQGPFEPFNLVGFF